MPGFVCPKCKSRGRGRFYKSLETPTTKTYYCWACGKESKIKKEPED